MNTPNRKNQLRETINEVLLYARPNVERYKKLTENLNKLTEKAHNVEELLQLLHALINETDDIIDKTDLKIFKSALAKTSKKRNDSQ